MFVLETGTCGSEYKIQHNYTNLYSTLYMHALLATAAPTTKGTSVFELFH